VKKKSVRIKIKKIGFAQKPAKAIGSQKIKRVKIITSIIASRQNAVGAVAQSKPNLLYLKIKKICFAGTSARVNGGQKTA